MLKKEFVKRKYYTTILYFFYSFQLFLFVLDFILNIGSDHNFEYSWSVWVFLIWIFLFLFHTFNVFVSNKFWGTCG